MSLSDELTQLENSIADVGTAIAGKNHSIETSVTTEATTRGTADTALGGMIGSDRGIVPVSGSASLTGDVFGYTYQTNTLSAAISTALPVAASANIGKKLTFFNSSGFNWTLTAGNFNTGYGSNTTSIVLPPNSTIVLEHDGVSYNGMAGTGQVGPKSTVSSAAPSGGANGDTWYQV